MAPTEKTARRLCKILRAESWRQVDFIGYLEDIKLESAKFRAKSLTKETYEATMMTTRSTVAVVECLLDDVGQVTCPACKLQLEGKASREGAYQFVFSLDQRGLSYPRPQVVWLCKQFTGNVRKNSQLFKTRLDLFLTATSTDHPNTEAVKAAILQSAAGDEALEVCNKSMKGMCYVYESKIKGNHSCVFCVI
ncbi:hypothetical protein HPB52_013105 [Rhipicephalus sanguineus]|uniref:Uncharacterized protein n=1 Tax=Rhipicephalus sanguineus TaxID=34632 RepID=A0A9D4PEA0_RHISA|nr:hypothetical protein HPB52_013105 [Rhipicephalus sanguineus]